MNIFILDNDINKNVQYYVDKHVVKMLLEHTQILSTVCRQSGLDAGYKATHIHHPCVKWAAASIDNFNYLVDLNKALHLEWQYRYKHPVNKLHKSYAVMLELPQPSLPNLGLTPFAQAMPEQYKDEDAVKAYRTYYKNDKIHLANWKNREIPYWW